MTDAELIVAGYDAVYRAYPGSPTLERIWREGTHQSGSEDLQQISFITAAELRQISDGLAIPHGATLLDLGCGTGGPGLWIAAQSGAHLLGLDISRVAVERAAERAERLGSAALFRVGRLERTGLDDESVDAAISIDALQYAPDKAAVLREAARVLRPGARVGLTTFELDPERAAPLPIYGSDPAPDLRPMFERAGFAIEYYAETAGWRERVTRIFEAVLAARDKLAAELGPAASTALVSEANVALSARIYTRRVLAIARRS
jgi:ubiquinone/menaquinone biosynthesis C-methylase UbiE